MKEAAIKSTSCLQPNLISSISWVVKIGSLELAPGMLTPLFSLMVPGFLTSITTSESLTSTTSVMI